MFKDMSYDMFLDSQAGSPRCRPPVGWCLATPQERKPREQRPTALFGNRNQLTRARRYLLLTLNGIVGAHPRPDLTIVMLIATLVAASALALGCASTATADDVASRHISAALPGKLACFRVADFDGSWIALNGTELIVSDSRTYLIALSEPVYDLKLRYHLGCKPYPPDTDHNCNASNA